MTVSVMVVDDHPVVRSGLAALLSAQTELQVLAEAATGEDALELMGSTRPQVVLTDLRMGPGMDGVALTAALRELADPPAVIILTTYDHDHDIVRAIEAGAAGYLLKDADPATITAAVLGAAAGRDVLDPDLARRAARSLGTTAQKLSDREIDVLALVDRGLSNRQIAAELHISEATVKTHLVHIYTKLGVDNRTSAVARGRGLGLIS